MLRKLFRNRVPLTGMCEELGLPLSVVLLISGKLQDSHPLHLLAQQLSLDLAREELMALSAPRSGQDRLCLRRT